MNFIKQLNPKANKEYEYVEDQKDLRIPVQSEEAFASGVQFKAKFIGTQEISRPSTRVEIVTAMRRIRYEFKYRNIKKRKVFLEISVNGIRVSLRKKQKKQVNQETIRDDYSLFIMHYPINRVFYVSHDSQDLKIFSFIARSDDGSFKCSVFKAIRKSTAMNIVRTIGQAFEVCHKLNNGKDDGKLEANTLLKDEKQDQIKTVDSTDQPISNLEDEGETDIDDLGDTDVDEIKSPVRDLTSASQKSTLVTDIDNVKSAPDAEAPMSLLPRFSLPANGDVGTTKFVATNFHQVQQLYHQQLMHQIHETEVMKSELTLVKEQLRVESSSRADAQARVHRLLAQNRELIVTIQKLTGQLQEKHCKIHGEAVDDSWVLNPALTSRDTPSTTNPFAATTNNKQPPANTQQTALIDFESSVFDNVYQFANFDTNKTTHPATNGLPRGDTRPSNTAKHLNNNTDDSKTGYSPLKSIYSSESEDVSDSSWKDDSQDEEGSVGLGLVATNVTNSNNPMQQFAQNMMQAFPNRSDQFNGHK